MGFCGIGEVHCCNLGGVVESWERGKTKGRDVGSGMSDGFAEKPQDADVKLQTSMKTSRAG